MQFSCATHLTSLQQEKSEGLLDMVHQKDVHVEKVLPVLLSAINLTIVASIIQHGRRDLWNSIKSKGWIGSMQRHK